MAIRLCCFDKESVIHVDKRNCEDKPQVKQIDRYILVQLLGPFIFFMLVFAGILWLNQALKVIDLVVDNGQSGLVFLEISLYLLPKTMEAVVSLAAFSASVFLTNRLFTESELVIIMNAGRGPFAIAKPYFIFGFLAFALVFSLTHYITPKSVEAFNETSFEIRKDFVVKVIQEGEFVNPDKGVTLFFGETRLDGGLTDIFIQEDSIDGVSTYIAPSGRLLTDTDEPKLLLINGTIQQYAPTGQSLTIGQFETLSYDLSQFGDGLPNRAVSELEYTTPALVNLITAQHNSDKNSSYFLQIHRRILDALIAFAAPLVGVSVLLVGRFQRTGFLLRIIGSVIVVIGVFSIQGAAITGISESPKLWPLAYLPSILTFLLCWFLLWYGGRSSRPSRRKMHTISEATP
jgi:lipopolysaccharide export system permease protein